MPKKMHFPILHILLTFRGGVINPGLALCILNQQSHPAPIWPNDHLMPNSHWRVVLLVWRSERPCSAAASSKGCDPPREVRCRWVNGFLGTMCEGCYVEPLAWQVFKKYVIFNHLNYVYNDIYIMYLI